MKTSRWGAALIAAAVLAGGLTACSSGASAGKTELVVWDPGLLTKTNDDGKVDTSRSFLHQAAAAYEKDHKDVSIKIVETSGDISKSSAQFQAASIAGNGPDVRIGYTGGNTISYSKFLLDLDNVFSEKTKSDLSGLNTVRDGYKASGKLDALPYGGGSYFYVFYDKKKIADAGLDFSTPPATWQQLLDDAKKIKATGQNPFWVANQEGYVGAWVVAALTGGQLGSSVFTEMYNGKIKLDNAAMVKSYKAYAQLYSEGLTNPDAGSVSNGDNLSGFVQGKGAMYISGGWDNSSLTKAVGDNVGVFPIPMLAGSKYSSTVAGGPNVAVSITKYSKHIDAAKDFLRYLAKPSTIDLYVKLFQVEASNSKSADASVITDPLLKSEAEGLKNTKNVVFPFDNVMPQAVIDLFYKVNATTFLGTTTPTDAVKQLQEAFTKETAN